jgi:RNA 2',3'-cyclic 3'-phosphodiesterase
MMRVFLSCHLSDRIASYIASLAEKVRSLQFEKEIPLATLTIPNQFDLTIKFFGEVNEEVESDICQRLESVHVPSFEVTLAPIQVFDPERIRIVWVGLSPKDSFCTLHTAVETALLPLFPPDNRFCPHITLARVKSVRNRKEFLEKLQSIEVDPLSFSIDKMTLFQSVTTQDGAQHTPLSTFRLGSKSFSNP